MSMTEEQQANENALWDDFLGEIPCDTCKHNINKDGTCTAFPKGIPTEILSGSHDHRIKPHPLDNGILYDSVVYPLASTLTP
jgi:hypothetical protein